MKRLSASTRGSLLAYARRGLLLASLLLLCGAASAPSGEAIPAANRAMEARLRAIYAGTDWKGDPNKPRERAQYLRSVLVTGKLSREQLSIVYPELVFEQLRAGDARAALQTLDGMDRFLNATGPAPAAAETQLHELRALAWLRLGEQENCLLMHGTRSCVFPLKESSVHVLPEGAEGAVRDYTWLLQHNPDDALSRWLLNVAFMQLGQYPRNVHQQWLLPASLYKSEADLGEFPDMASLAGVDAAGHAGGAIVEDFDGDGFMDIVTSSSGPLDPMHLFHNNGDGTFADVGAHAGLAGELGGLNLVLTDFDNDGHPDILVLRGGWWGSFGNYPLSLLRNCGDGTFEDVTDHAGLLRNAPTQTAAWADFDGDGWLDLFVGYESTPGNNQPSVLYHNNGDGTFRPVSLGLPKAVDAFVKGVAWGDFNNDGRPDLYISMREGRNMLLRNDGPADPAHPNALSWRFTDVAAQAGVVPTGNAFATWFFDYDNDGWPDLFVAGYYTGSMQDVGRFEAGMQANAGLPHLYRNNHDGTFRDVSHQVHLDRAILTMGANFGDLDNDGWLDVYLGTGDPSYQALLPNRMFRNDRGKAFQDITTSGGFGHLQKGHAVAFADLENRGHEDIFEEMGGAFVGDTYQAALYRNPGHAGHSITLKLEGTRSNRAAYGTRIDVAFHEAGVERHVFRTVGAVSSFGGNPMEQHIGIGSASRVDGVRLRWPGSSTEQVIGVLEADKYYRVHQGAGPLQVARKVFQLGARFVATPMHP